MFDDFLEILDEDDFEEKPVDIKTFVESKDYLGLEPLSEIQYTLVTASTQIYKRDTLVELYGPIEGDRLWKLTVNEVIAQLGKASGKDYCSTISVAYIVYKLLCLRDPAAYFGKPSGDNIDILNIAINAQQARNVFFKGLKTRIKKSPWFTGKYSEKVDSLEFEKNITCYSGHSERESWEGYNFIAVILDEISGFAVENTTGSEQAKTAEAIYKMYRASVRSRFAATGKIILLSFPRYKGDFIQARYDAVIAERDIEIRSMRFKLNEDLPDDAEGNEFEIDWEVDHIITYKEDGVFAIKRPSWDVNPTITIHDFKNDFYNDPVDTLSRFACMPPEAIDAFFKSREKIEKAFSSLETPFDDSWRFRDKFKPLEGRDYYVHVDLAYKHDRAAVALAHVETWIKTQITAEYAEPMPLVKIDAVRYWTPKSDQNVDFTEIINYILGLRQRGFNIKLVTFDRWNSIDTMNTLRNKGLEVEVLSVAKAHYEDLALLVAEERIKGYRIEVLIDELLGLRIIKGNKVDHPRTGSKDLADAVCGAAYNAVAYTERERGDLIVEAHYLDSSYIAEQTNKVHPDNQVIRPPKRDVPDDLALFMSNLEIL